MNRSTENAMTYKTLHRKQKIEEHELLKYWRSSEKESSNFDVTVPVPPVAPVELLLNDSNII